VALYAYLIDTVKVNGVYQVKGAPEFILDAGEAIRQQMDLKTRGGIHEIAIGFASNNNDKLYVGGTIGIPLLFYTSEMDFMETDTSARTNNHFKSFEYRDKYSDQGVGINLRLGIIYRPQDYIRLGLAVHSPSYMVVNEERTTSLTTYLENPVGSFNAHSNTFTNGMPGKYKFGQSTAWKVIGSASYVFREIENVKKQKAFISADVEYVTHGASRFSSLEESATPVEKQYYKDLGKVIDKNYKGAFNFRIGGELKFNTIMTRLGFGYYGNPYDKTMNVKANRMLLSGGLGYRHKGIFFDLTYVQAISKDVNFPYSLADRANTYASVKQQKGNVIASFGIKF
jgi:long-subunit fatty acid transport protein